VKRRARHASRRASSVTSRPILELGVTIEDVGGVSPSAWRWDGSIVLTPVGLVPESQLWILEEPHRSRIARGLAWAAETKPDEMDVDALLKRRRRGGGRTRGRGLPGRRLPSIDIPAP
jgi:hypothetical protein